VNVKKNPDGSLEGQISIFKSFFFTFFHRFCFPLLFSFLGLPEEWAQKLIEREQDFILTAKVEIISKLIILY
jgi:hypothetical protein